MSPGQGSRSSMPQITVHVSILRIPQAAAKAQHSQKKKKNFCKSVREYGLVASPEAAQATSDAAASSGARRPGFPPPWLGHLLAVWP